MTIASEVNRSGPYNGNGVTTVFDYDFKIVSDSHLQVIKRNAANIETVLTLGADYTVSGVGSANGGSITMTAAPVSGEVLIILLNVPFTQDTDLENQGAYYAETVEASLDLAAQRDLQLKEQLSRTVKLPATAPLSDLGGLALDIARLADSADEIDTVAGIADEIPDAASLAPIIADIATVSANKDDVSTVADIHGDVSAVAAIDEKVSTVADNIADVNNFADLWLGPKADDPATRNDGTALQEGDAYFNTAEKQLRIWDLTNWQPVTGSVIKPTPDSFVGDGIETTFVLSLSADDDADVLVWQQGVRQRPTVDYTVAGTALTFATAPAGGDVIDTLVISTVTPSAVIDAAAEARADRILAQEAADIAQASMEASGPFIPFDTKAEATASLALLSNGDIVEVQIDEDHGGARTRYVVQSGSLVFKRIAGMAVTDKYMPAISGAVERVTILSGLDRWLDPASFQVKRDGTGDNSAKLNAWQAALKDKDVFRAQLPQGVYNIGDTPLEILDGISFLGSGSDQHANDGTVLNCVSAASQVRVGGYLVDGETNVGGRIGGFSVHGNELATDPLYIGCAVQRIFEDIMVFQAGAGGNAVLIEDAQNCVFNSLCVEHGLGKGLVLDRGVGGLLFLRPELNGHAEENLVIRETSGGIGPYVVPTHIKFVSPIVERAIGATTARISAGQFINFDHAVFHVSNDGDLAGSTVLIDGAGVEIQISRARIYGKPGAEPVVGSVGLEIASGATVTALGILEFFACVDAVKGDGILNYTNVALAPNVTNLFGAGAATRAGNRSTALTRIARPAVADTAFIATVDGDTNRRYEVTAGGVVRWGTGAAAFDTSLYRAAAGRLATSGVFQSLGGMVVPKLSAAPSTPLTGMIVLADRVNWDPAGIGSGNEYAVIYTGGGWRRIDAAAP